MIRLTLAQMRRSTGRLTAAALAIVVGTAFVTATLLGGSLIRDTAYRAVTASIADADVVVHPAGQSLGPEQLEAIRALPGVRAADGVASLGGQLRAGARQDVATLAATPSDDALDAYELLEGRAPTATGELAVTAASAARLHVGLGDTVEVTWERFVPGASADDAGSWAADSASMRVTGVLADPPPLFAVGSSALISATDLTRWLQDERSYESVLVTGDPSPEALAAAVSTVAPGTVVRTAEQQAEHETARLTGDAQTLTYFVLGFAAVAMFVAAQVIANTFQVLVAQRTHTLALLRCTGATTSQVRRSVLSEALLLGVTAGAAGLLTGLALGQGALWVLAGADLGLTVPSTLPLSAAVLVVPPVTATVVTVLAALGPAHAATRVAPVAALRPAPDGAARRAGRLRRRVATGLTGTGALLLLAATAGGQLLAHRDVDVMGPALALGVLGGMVSFAGVVVGAVFLVPRAVRGLGALAVRLAGRHGRTVELAAVNATRNPHRTATTASALLIGVTLVVMMATGAASVRTSLAASLDEQFPVDLAVSRQGAQSSALAPAHIEAVRGVGGVEELTTVTGAPVRLRETEVDAVGLDPAGADGVVRHEALHAGLADGVALVDPDLAADLGVVDGDRVDLRGAGAEPVPVTARVQPTVGAVALTTATLERLAPAPPVTAVWASVSPSDAAGTIRDVQDAVAAATAAGEGVPIAQGPAAEREQIDQIIGSLLTIVVGLLAVAVVIALIGVANTLSLSVLERRREHAVLRAMGLTRGQLRTVLAVEGTLIALTGTALGAALGLLFGWAGTTVLVGAMGELRLTVPWAHLGAVGAVAVLAGLLASVLPARAAVRTPPVAALAA